MAGGAQERTEQATPRRLSEARRKGQVARSADLTGAICLLGMVAFLYAVKDKLFSDLQQCLAWYFGQAGRLAAGGANCPAALYQALQVLVSVLAPFLLLAVLVALAANIAQVGFLFTTETVKPKLQHINPAAGLGRIFSARSLVELVKSVLKFAAIGTIVVLLIKGSLDDLLLVFYRPPAGIYAAVMGFILKVAWWGALAYLALALLDYFYQRYAYKKGLMMSRQEVKEELKETEGDPIVRARQREMRRAISLNQIISEVPKATVVVTNPTQLAVALRYVQGETAAPVVVAKGAGYLAGQIRKIAEENGVPVVEDVEVARFLYYHVEVGMQIPYHLYRAVAKILAFVYQLKAKENYRPA